MTIPRNLSVLAQGAGSNQTLTLTNTSANALTIGRQGTTNPVLNVDASTASVVTGLNVKGAAAAGGVALSVTSSGTNENLTIDAKGSGTVSVNATGTGSVLVNRLLNISAATAGQIQFPATQNASTDANTLDDYEEGTWTPGVSFGGGTTGITYGNRDADYIKIGKNVFVVSACKMTNKGSSTGSAKVTGLPFTTGGGTEAQYAHQAACSYFNMGAFTGVGAVATINTGSATTLDCSYYASGSSGAITSLTDTNFTNTSQVFFSLSYLATT